MRDPWLKTTLRLQHSALGVRLQLRVPYDVFSTQQIDEGTLLLLDHLPPREPSRVLDMGCGYGALGLPIAARYPLARVELVDRDLVAVKWAGENARANGLAGVEAYGSLGFRDLRSSDPSMDRAIYDWILCNVPARIGRPFIESLMAEGRTRLASDGELRVVVINDLAPLLTEIADQNRWPLVQVARGPRHTVFSLPAAASGESIPSTQPDLYLRDQVEIGGLRLDRPFDLGGDDPRRLATGLPVLIDALPRQLDGKVLCFRCGYGALPLLSRTRWPEARVVAVDRDLLGTSFVRRNAEKLGLQSDLLDVRESADLPSAIQEGERFDLIVGELSPSAGAKVAEAELLAVAGALQPGGQALILSLEKLEKEWVRSIAARSRLAIHPLLRRERYVVLGIRGAGSS